MIRSDASHRVLDGVEGGGDLPRVRENLWCPFGTLRDLKRSAPVTASPDCGAWLTFRSKYQSYWCMALWINTGRRRSLGGQSRSGRPTKYS